MRLIEKTQNGLKIYEQQGTYIVKDYAGLVVERFDSLDDAHSYANDSTQDLKLTTDGDKIMLRPAKRMLDL